MVFELLDERIQSVLDGKGIGEPTGPQRAAIPVILSGKNVLLVAPTGIGKTEAAMLPILHNLLGLEGKGIKCLYITPLRALNRDMLRRLEEFGQQLGISVAVRHGDTTQSERNRQSRKPPDVLITTPETLQILFTGRRLREHLANIRYLVVDEIHELADDERGAQLSVSMERLVSLTGEYQRVGLSATVGTIEEVARFLGGNGRKVSIIRGDITKEMSVQVQSPGTTDADRDLAGTLQSDPQLVSCMRRCRELVERHRSTLVFVNTRDTAEALAARYHVWDENFPIGVHHGSLSKDIRIQMEDDFKEERLRGLISTSSLEMGIDIGSADFAIQYNSPRQVTRLIQRMGRAGHKVGLLSEGAVVASNPDEVGEGLVISRRAITGEIEPLRVRENPLTVVANQLLSMGMVGEVETDWAYETIRKAYPFRNLARSRFDEVLEQLSRIGLVFVGSESYRRSRRGMKYFYDNISMIPDERTFKIRDIGTRKIVGTLDESFVITFAEPFATFITRGRSWRIVEIGEDELLVEQVNEIGSVPSWVGEDIPVPMEVAMEVGRLRRTLDLEGYPGDEGALTVFRDFVEEGGEDFPVPTDKLITIEVGRKMVIINACFGTRVNETISKILSVLLTARLGESVGVRTDPYRIILELPRDLNPQIIVNTMKSIRADSIESLMKLVLRNSSYLRWRFVYVAKKFGVIERDADHRTIRFQRLVETFEDTVLVQEAIDKVLWEDLDLESTRELSRKIEEGEIEFQVCGISPFGRAGLQHSKDMIMPQRADHSILMALKKRLEVEPLYLTCLNCHKQWRTTPLNAEKKIVCPHCGGHMVAALHGYNKEDVKLLKKKNPNEEEGREVRRMYKNANLVKENGRQALLALAGRGIGPDAAARILSGFYDNEDEFLRDILSAEINYARTKRFWD
ncbi:MAG: DEAD/DEAH box helicase [Methanomassiliicoccales archaeon]|nr:DEAD/DEAH box helicase [Methanomassiliicoccales archaeon]